MNHYRTRGGRAAALPVIAVLMMTGATSAAAHDVATKVPQRWVEDANLSWAFTSGFPDTTSYRNRVRDGLQPWASAATPLTWQENPEFSATYDPYLGCPSSKGRNGIFWRSDVDNYASVDDALAAVFKCSKPSGEIWSASMVFDSTADGTHGWYAGTGTPGPGQYDLWQVATHEWGHVMGLNHFAAGSSECSSPKHTMCPSSGLQETALRSLESHDIHTFESAYRRAAWLLNTSTDSTAESTRKFGWQADTHKLVGNWEDATSASADVTDDVAFRMGKSWFLDHDGDLTYENAFDFGRASDVPVTGDWDGDGDDDVGVVRDTEWYLSTDDHFEDGTHELRCSGFGNSNHVRLAGDWDNDGIDEPTTINGNTWYLNGACDGTAEYTLNWGSSGMTFLMADWNGDGTDDLTAVDGNTWYVNYVDPVVGVDTTTDAQFTYGSSGDTKVTGNWDGSDTADEPAVVRGA